MDSSKPAGGTRILERPGQASVLVLRRARLVVVKGPDKGLESALERSPLLVGTDPTCDFVLADAAVSSRHLELSLEPQGCVVRDLASRNGTFVDGTRVREVFLPDGAELVLGETTLRYTLQKGEVELPLASGTNFGELLGHSPAMRAVFAILERAAASEATVLVQGESGTGKELAARALHQRSPRAPGPYLVLDCGAASPNLIESQLFGHVRGAFTGADDARVGLFEDAAGGTLVLDEIGELPLELQPKLLRAVEARTIQRLGETRTRAVDTRLVACTHRNLEREVKEGRFRQDLFFRLSVISVRLPPLRERREEIPRLVSHFLTRFGGDLERDVPRAVMNVLMSHSWPGNVRELRNVVERLVVLPGLEPGHYVRGEEQRPEAPPSPAPAVPTSLDFHEAKRQWTDRFEREYLARLLAEHGGNVSEVARVSGLSRQSCHRLMNKHGLDAD